MTDTWPKHESEHDVDITALALLALSSERLLRSAREELDKLYARRADIREKGLPIDLFIRNDIGYWEERVQTLSRSLVSERWLLYCTVKLGPDHKPEWAL